ncbi:MAG TPA: hypothetical protein VHR45_19315 [Thermoanaerobaculia bacterium]|nr:hypothetical protein [Thermoanaerobaculia bacterium]
MTRAIPKPVCVFLTARARFEPRNSSAVLWRLLQDALIARLGSVTGPENVLYYRGLEPVPGAWWSPGKGEKPVKDLSRKYTVAIPAERVDELRGLLRRAGNSFDQRVVYLEVAGYAELLEVKPDDGFLEV